MSKPFRLSDQQYEQARKLFGCFDENKDGQVELKEIAKALGRDPEEELMKKLIAFLDTNKDGTVSFIELTRGLERMHAKYGQVPDLANAELFCASLVGIMKDDTPATIAESVKIESTPAEPVTPGQPVVEVKKSEPIPEVKTEPKVEVKPEEIKKEEPKKEEPKKEESKPTPKKEEPKKEESKKEEPKKEEPKKETPKKVPEKTPSKDSKPAAAKASTPKSTPTAAKQSTPRTSTPVSAKSPRTPGSSGKMTSTLPTGKKPGGLSASSSVPAITVSEGTGVAKGTAVSMMREQEARERRERLKKQEDEKKKWQTTGKINIDKMYNTMKFYESPEQPKKKKDEASPLRRTMTETSSSSPHWKPNSTGRNFTLGDPSSPLKVLCPPSPRARLLMSVSPASPASSTPRLSLGGRDSDLMTTQKVTEQPYRPASATARDVSDVRSRANIVHREVFTWLSPEKQQ